MNNKGSLMSLPMNLLMLFLSVTFLVAMIPGFVSIIDTAQQSNSLNCAGYKYLGSATHSLAYNSSIDTSTMACLAIKLYIPYIVLGVLIAGVGIIFYGGSMFGGQQQQQGSPQMYG